MSPMSPLSADQKNRFARHILMDSVGEIGQQKLLNAKVLVVGVGGLGSPVLLYLTASGVGTLGIIDFDTVDISNLQRQVIHTEYDVGGAKVSSAVQSISALNSKTIVQPYRDRMDEKTFFNVAQQYDVIVDATDNFASRYTINRLAVQLKTPLVSGSLQGWSGQIMCISCHTACYQCIFPTAPDTNHATTCTTAGVIGSVAGVIGSLQATEVLKILLGTDGILYNQILTVNTQNMHFEKIAIAKDSMCSGCGVL